MARLLLIRHSTSRPIEGVAPRDWPLSDEGRAACAPFAERLRPYAPRRIVASREPKAAETGRLVADRLGLAWEVADGLHEHERDAMPWLGGDRWADLVADLFRRPDELVFGRETAAQAAARFAAAVDGLAAGQAEGGVAVASHATVMSLFVARHNPVDPFTFWRGLAMPDLIVLDLPGYRLLNQPA